MFFSPLVCQINAKILCPRNGLEELILIACSFPNAATDADVLGCNILSLASLVNERRRKEIQKFNYGNSKGHRLVLPHAITLSGPV